MAIEKYSAEWWKTEIRRAKEETARSRFYNLAEESIKEYEGRLDLPGVERRCGIWWSIVQSVLPAYYSQPPKVESQLRAKSGNQLHVVAALATERGTQYCIDEHMDIDKIAINAVMQYLLTGQGVLWPRYESNTGVKEYEIALLRQDDGSLVDADGDQYAGDDAEVRTDKDGGLFYSKAVEAKMRESAIIDVVHYRDFLTSCARNPQEIEWKARRAYLSKAQAKEIFGEEADEFSFDAYPEDLTKGEGRKDKEKYEGKAEIWEIYCEESGKVYHLNDRNEGPKMAVGDPPVKYRKFYPSSELCANLSPDSAVPLGDWAHAKDLVMEVERLTTRIHATVQAIRSNFAYDKSLGDEIEGLLEGDLKMVPIQNWPSFRNSRGGLAQGMESLPVQQYVANLQSLMQARMATLERLYETMAVSDLVRGVSSPIETATAQQLKANYSNLRFRVRQLDVANFLNDAIEKVGEIVSEHFSPDYLYQIVNGEELVGMLPAGAKWESVIELLRNDEQRRFRVNIATDSIVQIDEAAEHQRGTQLVNSIGQFLGSLQGLVKEYPSIAPMAMSVLQFSIRRYRDGKELEAVFMRTLGVIAKEAAVHAQQLEAQANQQNPGAAESQVQLQIAQMGMQQKREQLQVELQVKGMEASFESQKAQIDAQLKQAELGLKMEQLKLEQFKLQQEAMMGSQEMAIKSKEIDSKDAQAALKAQMDQRMAQVNAMIEGLKIENDRTRTMLETQERLIEERRLSQENAVKVAEKSQPLPPINITVEASKAGKRKGTIVKNPDGSATFEQMDVIE